MEMQNPERLSGNGQTRCGEGGPESARHTQTILSSVGCTGVAKLGFELLQRAPANRPPPMKINSGSAGVSARGQWKSFSSTMR